MVLPLFNDMKKIVFYLTLSGLFVFIASADEGMWMLRIGIYYFADSLSSKGIATFRFNNRAFTDSLKGNSKDPDRFTLWDGVEDLNYIIAALESDSRFKESKIGLLEHSKGG